MKLAISLGYSGANMALPVKHVQEAEALGYDSVWTAESYGSDAITPLAYLAAVTTKIKLGTSIMQIPGRTPAMCAMTMATLDALSGGRAICGLGLSGPQVVEGWHGVAYGKPLTKTREYVHIVRDILKREKPLVHNGDYYQIPYQGADATGLGKPLKSILHGRADMPIYLAAIGPKNVQLCAEIADGWLPIFFSPEHYDSVYKPQIEAGFAAAGNGKSLANFDIAPTVQVMMDDNLESCWNALKPGLALYIGGMGAKGRNFYNDLAVRYGFEEAATTIQELYLAGDKAGAVSAIPNELVDAVALCGSKARIKDRLALWRSSPITTLNLGLYDVDTLRTMCELVL